MTVNRPVIVGVDGSPASLGAVSWAAAESVRTGAPLQVLFAYHWHWPGRLVDSIAAVHNRYIQRR